MSPIRKLVGPAHANPIKNDQSASGRTVPDGSRAMRRLSPDRPALTLSLQIADQLLTIVRANLRRFVTYTAKLLRPEFPGFRKAGARSTNSPPQPTTSHRGLDISARPCTERTSSDGDTLFRMSLPNLSGCALFLLLSYGCVGQEIPSAPDHEETSIRAVVDDYLRARRQGDAGAVKALIIPGARGASAGGTGNGELAVLRSASARQGRASFLRRIQVLSPTVATAVGIWREFDVTAPFDAGRFQYTLLRTGEGWKIVHSHEAFLPVPAEHQIAVLVPDPVNSVGSDG